jgi:hypothetical protein
MSQGLASVPAGPHKRQPSCGRTTMARESLGTGISVTREHRRKTSAVFVRVVDLARSQDVGSNPHEAHRSRCCPDAARRSALRVHCRDTLAREPIVRQCQRRRQVRALARFAEWSRSSRGALVSDRGQMAVSHYSWLCSAVTRSTPLSIRDSFGFILAIGCAEMKSIDCEE